MTNPSIRSSLRSVIEERREFINQKVRYYTQQQKTLDPTDFSKHLREFCDPLVERLESVNVDRSRSAVFEMILVSLDLFRAGQLVSQSGSTSMRRLWTELFPKIANHIHESPKSVVGQFCNGLIFMEQRSSSQAHAWMDGVLAHLELIQDASQLLKLGKIMAWISGLAAYRQSAISEAKELPLPVTANLFAIDKNEVLPFLEELESQPWMSPRTFHDNQNSTPIIRMKCCAFMGLGGELRYPPLVGMINQQLAVSDGEKIWNLFADRFGWMTQATNYRPDELTRKPSKTSYVNPQGVVRWKKENTLFEELIGNTSQVFDGHMLAVTTQTSFHVFLITNSD